MEGLMWMSVDELLPWEANPRKNDAAIRPVAKSILRWGFASPVVVWANQNRIVAGHTRLAAVQFLQQNRLEKTGILWESRPDSDPFHIPVGISKDGSMLLAPGPDLVPVRFMEFSSEKEANAYALADNKLGELAEWDEDALADLLRGESGEDPLEGLDDLGWDENELDDILNPASVPRYTPKIKAPIYEPKGTKPLVRDLIDRDYTEELLAEIAAVGEMEDEVRQFLELAAERHTSFHFARIAEWYCHATPEVQGLMERSGLVIIDYDAAIENGFVHLSKRLNLLADQDK